jgi:hypothetical protein
VLEQGGEIAGEQGSASAEVVRQNYRAPPLRRGDMQEQLIEAFTPKTSQSEN